MGILPTAIFISLSFLLGLFATSLKSYVSKKGENLATKEDVAELTRIAKEIEAKVSDEVWSRQRRWELKREAAFEALKELGTLHMAVRTLAATYASLSRKDGSLLTAPETQARTQLQHKALATFDEASSAFGKAMLLTWAVCGQNVQNQLAITEQMLVGIALSFVKDPGNTGSIAEVMMQMVTKINEVAIAIRSDLEIFPK